MSENKNFFRASAEDFKKIPGSPVAYWVSGGMRKAFSELPPLSSIAVCKQGIATANNDLFLRTRKRHPAKLPDAPFDSCFYILNSNLNPTPED